ncbi:mucin-2-like [Capsicum annuum]|uniref:mucin-2-like n=1 Tax=Capsicum annuum TaxID=4072 RepID=UPI001FB14A12|nr:mucin-2-like [Capsicum annuum]
MASKGHGNGRHKKGEKGLDNLSEGQYTPPSLPPVTTNLQPATTNIIPPLRAAISLPNAFFMPPPPHQFQPSSPHNSLHSSSSSVPSTSSTPNLSELRIEGPSTSTSPSIDSDAASNATTAASQIPKFKKVVEYDGNRGKLSPLMIMGSFLIMPTDIWL